MRRFPAPTSAPTAMPGNLFLYESGGLMRQNILMANFNTRFSRGVSLFGNYSLNYANDLPGTPSNPYNFAQDWGRSSLDRRHRFQLVGSVAAPWGLRLSPFVTLQSGSPYDVLIGRDLYGDTITERSPGARGRSGAGSRRHAVRLFRYHAADRAGASSRAITWRAPAWSPSMCASARPFGFGEPRGGPARRRRCGGGGGSAAAAITATAVRAVAAAACGWAAAGPRRNVRRHRANSPLQSDDLGDVQQRVEPRQSRRLHRHSDLSAIRPADQHQQRLRRRRSRRRWRRFGGESPTIAGSSSNSASPSNGQKGRR